MANFQKIIGNLRVHRQGMEGHLKRLDAAISALKGLNGTRGKSTSARPRRKMSASARAKIAAAQRARWAKWKRERKKAG